MAIQDETNPAGQGLSTGTPPGMHRRRFLTKAAGGALALTAVPTLLSACGGSGSSSTSAGGGKPSGQLNLMAWSSYGDAETTAAFTKSSGVTFKNQVLGTNEEILTKLKAGGLGSVDLASPNIAYAASLHAADVIQPIDYDRLPNAKFLLPEMLAAVEESATFDGDKYALPLIWGYDAMIYNATVFPQPPTSWEEVMDPENAGRVVMIEGPNSNFETWPRMLGYDFTKLTKSQLGETTDFLIEQKKSQVRTVTGDLQDIADILSRGDASILNAATWIGLPTLAKSGGDKVAATIPKEGGVTWIDSFVLAKDAPNVDAAYAWLNDAIGVQTQLTMVGLGAGATTNTKAVPQVPAENKELYGYEKGQIGSSKNPLFQFPPEGGDYSDQQEWAEAWERISAA